MSSVWVLCQVSNLYLGFLQQKQGRNEVEQLWDCLLLQTWVCSAKPRTQTPLLTWSSCLVLPVTPLPVNVFFFFTNILLSGKDNSAMGLQTSVCNIQGKLPVSPVPWSLPQPHPAHALLSWQFGVRGPQRRPLPESPPLPSFYIAVALCAVIIWVFCIWLQSPSVSTELDIYSKPA